MVDFIAMLLSRGIGVGGVGEPADGFVALVLVLAHRQTRHEFWELGTSIYTTHIR